MSSNGIITTVVGWAATAPREIQGGRVPYTSFRLATTPRHYDRSKGAWVEGRTEWLTVKVFRDTALNVATSVLKGQPVVVYGRLKTEEWLGENGPRSGLVLEATALGHDLTRGRATFVKVTRVAPGSADGAGTGDGDAVGHEGAEGAGADRVEDAPDVDPWALDAHGTGAADGDADVDADLDADGDADVDAELAELTADGLLDGLDREESVPTP